MANLFQLVNQDAITLGGRFPEWLTQQDTVFPNGPPTAGSGVALGDTTRTQVRVGARERVAFRTSYIGLRPGVLDLLATYRLVIDANTVDFDAAAAGAANRADIIEGWATAINADVTIGAIVTAVPLDLQSLGVNDTIKITGNAAADYTITVTTPVVVGAPVVDVVADVAKVDIAIHVTWKPPGPAGVPAPDAAVSAVSAPIGSFPSDTVKFGASDWDNPNGAVYTTNGTAGFVEIFDTGGQDRLYVEVTALTQSDPAPTAPHTITHLPRITVGPARVPQGA